jgi:ATP-dependent protease HslVU (ClpYQ) ATPase subunit
MRSLLREMEEKFIEFENEELSPKQKQFMDVDDDNDIDEKDLEKLRSKNEESDLEEQNVTAAVAGFNTPYAFSKREKKVKYPGVAEAIDKKYEAIIESYRNFKHDDKKPSNKVKETIREIASKLKEIETLVNHSSRFKNEAGVTSANYGPGTVEALRKISERLVKISERVRALGE